MDTVNGQITDKRWSELRDTFVQLPYKRKVLMYKLAIEKEYFEALHLMTIFAKESLPESFFTDIKK